MGPIDIINNYGAFLGYAVSLLIGVGFGAVLEMSGFGDSRVLAGQFYLRNMTVLKVMFTAIIVAMTLIFFFSSVNLLDYAKVFVNPTYLWPGILGGLIMGVGFIIGGFCPGTSIVAMSTFKLDGLFFVVGTFLGVFAFGETVSLFKGFFNSGFMGRFTLPELFGLDTGIIVVGVIFMALMMFYGAEISEKFFGEKKSWQEISLKLKDPKKILASAVLIFVAMVTMYNEQPDLKERWNRIAELEEGKIVERRMFIHPGELFEVMNDNMLNSILVDVREESDYNLFHLEDAKNVPLEKIASIHTLKHFEDQPQNTVIVLISNNEIKSLAAYKILRAYGIINVYILNGGLNRWLDTFSIEKRIAEQIERAALGPEQIAYRFSRAVGSSVFPANPKSGDGHNLPELKFEKKVTVKKKQAMAGGCD